ncbi:MAG: NTP transferase domain-containing protein [Chloroflexi bacterium]|nr:NTP transferase domain-containing protein [Chloroflexota bacterium]
MSQIRKAVIPAAGMGTRLYPATRAVKKELFPVVGPDGVAKPVIQRIVEEALSTGVEEVCLVVRPGDEEVFRFYFSEPLSEELNGRLSRLPQAIEQTEHLLQIAERLRFVVQPTQEGFGHAVHCARSFVGDEPFLLLLGDHLYRSATPRTCAQQIIDAFEHTGHSVLATQRVPENAIYAIGVMAGEQDDQVARLYRLYNIAEKPAADYAWEHLRTRGLPDGWYLGIYGQYALTASIFDHLQYLIDHDLRERGEIQFTSALQLMLKDEPLWAYEVDGRSFDIGRPAEYAHTVAAFAGLI